MNLNWTDPAPASHHIRAGRLREMLEGAERPMDLVIGPWRRESVSMEVMIGTSPLIELDHGGKARLP